MTIKDIAKRLLDNDNFLIITHVRPDGDTIGSGSALCHALRKIGKTAYLYNNRDFADAFPWITDKYIAPEGYSYDYIVGVDMASEAQYPKGFDEKVNLCIDHHMSNTSYAEETLVWPNKASCGEIILEVVKELCELDADIADLLYVAVSTDTGCFVYGNTTAETLRAAAELCDAGASNTYLNKLLFRTSSKERMLLEAEIVKNMRYYHDGRTIIAIVTNEMKENIGVLEKDMKDIAALPGRIEGGNTSAVIKEVDATHCKISVRTNGIVNANEVCANFGGGGHKMAGGCLMNKNCFEAAELLAAAIAENEAKYL